MKGAQQNSYQLSFEGSQNQPNYHDHNQGNNN